MTTEQLILVIGATGTVGSAVVNALDDRDVSCRVAVRDTEAARRQFGYHHEYVQLDLEEPETWTPALNGVDRLFLVRPPAVSTTAIKSMVDAAATLNIEHIAYLSVLGAEKNPLVPHHLIERHLAASDVEYTFLRASFFMQNLAEVHRQDIIEYDEVFVPAGDGRTSFVDARDIGAVAAATLTEPSHQGLAYDLTGPMALNYNEVAATLSVGLDRPIEYASPSIYTFVRRMYKRNQPLPFIAIMVGIYTTARFGFSSRVTDDVEHVLGRPAIPFRQFVADYRKQFIPTAENF